MTSIAVSLLLSYFWGACLKIFMKYIWSEFHFNTLPKRFDSISLFCSLIGRNVAFWSKQNKMISDIKIQIRDQIWRDQPLTRGVSLVEQELLTLLEHLSSPRFLIGFVLLDLLLYRVCFVDRCLSFCPFSFGHCVVCPSLMYGFWLPLWYLQNLL